MQDGQSEHWKYLGLWEKVIRERCGQHPQGLDQSLGK